MGKWSCAPCPLAQETHEGEVDEHPSFEIYMDGDGNVFYKCWTCGDGELKPLSHLFGRMKEYFGEFPLQAHRIALSASKMIKLGAVDMSHLAQTEAVGADVLNRYPVLTRYTKDSSRFLKEYLRSRGVSDDGYEHFRVRYTPARGIGNHPPRTLVTEFTLRDQTVVALRLRTILKKSRRFATVGSFGPAMFGLAQADPSKALLVVEGEIDAVRAYCFGFTNVVATGGVNRNASALASVLKLWAGQKGYLGLDSDTAGRDPRDD